MSTLISYDHSFLVFIDQFPTSDYQVKSPLASKNFLAKDIQFTSLEMDGELFINLTTFKLIIVWFSNYPNV
ncbi:hypothetical protein P8452_56813 [Trifolium repens]|nr:hypothetical protein P8452_56813 [Trifolium repens]